MCLLFLVFLTFNYTLHSQQMVPATNFSALAATKTEPNTFFGDSVVNKSNWVKDWWIPILKVCGLDLFFGAMVLLASSRCPDGNCMQLWGENVIRFGIGAAIINGFAGLAMIIKENVR